MGSKERKAKDKIKKYYGWKTDTVSQQATTDTTRLQEDIATLLEESGLQQDRSVEDYIRNIGRIETEKSTSLDDLNYYMTTQSGRLTEDLASSLSKEARRFGLEGERINQQLADQGKTFSSRKPEEVAREGHEINVTDIQTDTNRSFQDIARYEATLNRDIELKYGQGIEEQEVTKKRSIEDILNAEKAGVLGKKRGIEDVAFGKAVDIKDLSYQKDTDLAQVEMMFDQLDAYEDMQKAYEDAWD